MALLQPRDRRAHDRGARDRRGRQHRPDAGHATPGRSRPPPNCDEANITLGAAADGWVDEVDPHRELRHRRASSASAPAPFGENARALVRFALPAALPADCSWSPRTLRLHSDGEPGRTLEALPLAAHGRRDGHLDQPAGARPATARDGAVRRGYREWDVTAHVEAMLAGAAEPRLADPRRARGATPSGAEQALQPAATRSPTRPQVPQLVLRFDGGTPTAAARRRPPSDSSRRTVECGQVLTESTRVANDLSCDCSARAWSSARRTSSSTSTATRSTGPDYLLTRPGGGPPRRHPQQRPRQRRRSATAPSASSATASC